MDEDDMTTQPTTNKLVAGKKKKKAGGEGGNKKKVAKKAPTPAEDSDEEMPLAAPVPAIVDEAKAGDEGDEGDEGDDGDEGDEGDENKGEGAEEGEEEGDEGAKEDEATEEQSTEEPPADKPRLERTTTVACVAPVAPEALLTPDPVDPSALAALLGGAAKTVAAANQSQTVVQQRNARKDVISNPEVSGLVVGVAEEKIKKKDGSIVGTKWAIDLLVTGFHTRGAPLACSANGSVAADAVVALMKEDRAVPAGERKKRFIPSKPVAERIHARMRIPFKPDDKNPQEPPVVGQYVTMKNVEFSWSMGTATAKRPIPEDKVWADATAWAPADGLPLKQTASLGEAVTTLTTNHRLNEYSFYELARHFGGLPTPKGGKCMPIAQKAAATLSLAASVQAAAFTRATDCLHEEQPDFAGTKTRLSKCAEDLAAAAKKGEWRNHLPLTLSASKEPQALFAYLGNRGPTGLDPREELLLDKATFDTAPPYFVALDLAYAPRWTSNSMLNAHFIPKWYDKSAFLALLQQGVSPAEACIKLQDAQGAAVPGISINLMPGTLSKASGIKSLAHLKALWSCMHILTIFGTIELPDREPNSEADLSAAFVRNLKNVLPAALRHAGALVSAQWVRTNVCGGADAFERLEMLTDFSDEAKKKTVTPLMKETETSLPDPSLPVDNFANLLENGGSFAELNKIASKKSNFDLCYYVLLPEHLPSYVSQGPGRQPVNERVDSMDIARVTSEGEKYVDAYIATKAHATPRAFFEEAQGLVYAVLLPKSDA